MRKPIWWYRKYFQWRVCRRTLRARLKLILLQTLCLWWLFSSQRSQQLDNCNPFVGGIRSQRYRRRNIPPRESKEDYLTWRSTFIWRCFLFYFEKDHSSLLKTVLPRENDMLSARNPQISSALSTMNSVCCFYINNESTCHESFIPCLNFMLIQTWQTYLWEEVRLTRLSPQLCSWRHTSVHYSSFKFCTDHKD
jgi:hypothetical protein